VANSEPTPSAAEIGEFAAAAKAHLDALVSTLSIPVPLLLGLAVATRSVGAGVASEVSFQGVKLPLAVGSMMILAFNGLMLLHVARLTASLSADWRHSERAKRVSYTISRHSGLLNPFFRLKPFDEFDRVLLIIPQLSVGMLLGFHLLFILTPPDVQVVFGGYLNPVAIVVSLLHLGGNFLATFAIVGLAHAMHGWTASMLIIVGYVVGMFLSYQMMNALGVM